MNMFKIIAWLIINMIVTWGLYWKVYTYVKKFQTDINNVGLKFLILLLFVWILVGAVLFIDNRNFQNIAMLLGIIISASVYTTFFIMKKFND